MDASLNHLTISVTDAIGIGLSTSLSVHAGPGQVARVGGSDKRL